MIISDEKMFSPLELSSQYNLKYDLILRNIKNGRIKFELTGGCTKRGEPKYLVKLSDFLKWLDYYYFSKGISNENK